MKLKITVDNKTYEVDVEVATPETETAPPRGYVAQPTPLRVPAVPVLTGTPPVSSDVEETKVCRSPISGIVVKVAAQVGQSIQSGDILLVLEAMKMETNITAPVAGKIKRINVSNGDSVQKTQVLVEFE